MPQLNIFCSVLSLRSPGYLHTTLDPTLVYSIFYTAYRDNFKTGSLYNLLIFSFCKTVDIDLTLLV